MNIQDKLKEQLNYLNRNESNSNDDIEWHKPKNPVLRLTKDEPSMFVRILPDAEHARLGKMFRMFFFSAQNKNGKQLKQNFILSEMPDAKSTLENAIQTWVNENRIPNPWHSKIVTRGAIHVMPIQVYQNGNYGYMTEEDGSVMVRAMEVPLTLFKILMSKIADNDQAFSCTPQGANDGWRYASLENGCIVQLFRTGEKTSTQYSAEVLTQYTLGKVPDGAMEKREDLDYIYTPTEEVAGQDYINYYISVADGTEEQYLESRRGNNSGTNQSQGQVQNQPQGNMNANTNTNTNNNQFTKPSQGNNSNNSNSGQQPFNQNFNQGTSDEFGNQDPFAEYSNSNNNTGNTANSGTPFNAQFSNGSNQSQPQFQQPTNQGQNQFQQPQQTANTQFNQPQQQGNQNTQQGQNTQRTQSPQNQNNAFSGVSAQGNVNTQGNTQNVSQGQNNVSESIQNEDAQEASDVVDNIKIDLDEIKKEIGM